MRFLRYVSALTALLAVWPLSPAQAGVRIGIGIGFPIFPGYYYSPYYYPYYPVVAPVVVAAPSTVVVAQPAQPAQPPTVVQPGYTPSTPPPPLAPVPAPEQLKTAPRPLTQTSAVQTPAQNAEITRSLQLLASGDEKTRSDAIIEPGRLKAVQALEPLQNALVNDRSAVVREAAARGLGLIASPSSLNALQLAAQADDDREVRSSARFAVDVIRSRQP